MKQLKLKSMVRMKKYRSYKGEIGKVAPNLINRDFHANRPLQKWTTDITEFSLFGKKLYLSPILDMFNGEIISYNISERPHLGQVMDMLDKAFELIPDNTGLIFHSDRGGNYSSRTMQLMPKSLCIEQSLSKSHTPCDNSVSEALAFFKSLKTEEIYRRICRSENWMAPKSPPLRE